MRDLLKLVEGHGWVFRDQKGSHRQYVHPLKPGKVTIAGHPSKDIDPTTKHSILKQARDQMSRYAVFIAPTATGFSAHVPDLPGCIAAGDTRQETLDLLHEAIEMHLAAMRQDGDLISEPSDVEILEVA